MCCFRKLYQDIGKIAQWLKGISSRVLLQEFAHLRKQGWGRHLWARGYLAVTSGTITNEMIEQYIEEKKVNLCKTMVDFQSTALKPLAVQARVV